ncbi:hypothetical protein, partial [Bacillus velezensis]
MVGLGRNKVGMVGLVLMVLIILMGIF